jgi:hypothetical protein
MGNVISLMWYEILGVVGVAGVAAGGFAWALFQAFGNKAIDNHFATKLAELRNEHERKLKEFQSTIDRDIHRAKKVYDREFDALSEAWLLLHESYHAAFICGSADALGLDGQPTDAEWQEFKKVYIEPDVETQNHPNFDVGADRLDQFTTWRHELQLKKFRADNLQCKHFIEQNSIFFSSGVKGMMLEVIKLNASAINEADANLGLTNKHGKDHNDLVNIGGTYMKSIEQNIHGRLWSIENASGNKA